MQLNRNLGEKAETDSHAKIHCFVGILAFLAFFSFPIFSLPFILYGIYYQKRYAFVLMALFMALFSILYPPVGDQYRYYIEYNYVLDGNLHHLFPNSWDQLLEQGEYLNSRISLIVILETIFKSMNMNFELLRFFLIFISYYICFSMCCDIINNSEGFDDYNYTFILTISFVLSIPFFYISSGFRYGMGMVLLCSSLYYLFLNPQKIKGGLCLIFAIWFHPFYFIYFVAIVLLKIVKINQKTFLPLICLFLFSDVLLSFLFSSVSLPNVFRYLDVYLDSEGEWKTGTETETWSVLHRISSFLFSFFFLVYVLFFYIKTLKYSTERSFFEDKKTRVKEIISILYRSIILWVCFINYYLVGNRIRGLIIFLISFLLFYFGIMDKKKRKYAYICMLFSIVFFMYQLGDYKNILKVSNLTSCVTSSFYSIITYTYNFNFIDKNIDSNGGLL